MHDDWTVTSPSIGAAEPQVPPVEGLPTRYRYERRLGSGGMGEVYQVWDLHLDRVAALKVLRDGASSGRGRDRFRHEIHLTARLDHPAIVPVYDWGALPDGRLWYTMRQVRGQTLEAVIARLHEASGPAGWAETDDGWTLRRVIDAVERACRAVGYAHANGVVHRDLKPANIMLGRFGEVFVMDWGVARALGSEEVPARSNTRAHSGEQTVAGAVIGTPAYMAPEQAAGRVSEHSARSDVFGLGAVIRQVLTGSPGGRGTPGSTGPVPPELAELFTVATAQRPDDRPENGEVLADRLRAWLDGAQRRQEALELVSDARSRADAPHRLRSRARVLRGRAATDLAALPPGAAAELKATAWELQDQAVQLEIEADIAELQVEQSLRAALERDPELPDAHRALADLYQRQHQAAELARDARSASRAERLLRQHDRGSHAAYLSGTGAVSLVTDPPGATVMLYRYESRMRRLEPRLVRELGRTPLIEVPLAHGSWLIEATLPGHRTLRYPVRIGRGEAWGAVRPGASEPFPIPLLPSGSVPSDLLYVPAGWFTAGGDADAPHSLERTQVWVDGFLLDRFPVTNGAYLQFLNDLARQGRFEEAERAQPTDPQQAADVSAGRPVFGRDGRGGFVLPEAEEHELPVVLIDWHSAAMYARYRGMRLPNELEWEKAARGVDGRIFPWGDHLDPSWTCIAESHSGPARRRPVGAIPTDVGPYGHEGLAGNVRDFCSNPWRPEGPRIRDGILLPDEEPPEAGAHRAERGGAWLSTATLARPATRFADPPDQRFGAIGFRLARTLTVQK